MADESPDPALAKFPPLDTRKSPDVVLKAVTVEDLTAAWANETGTSGKALDDRIPHGSY